MSNYHIEQKQTPQEFCQANKLPVELAGRIFLRPHHLQSIRHTLTNYLDLQGNFREDQARSHLIATRLRHIQIFSQIVVPNTPIIETFAEIEYVGLLKNSSGDTISPIDYKRIQNYEPTPEDISGMVEAELRIVKSILSLAPDTPVIVAGVLDGICRM